MVGVQRRVIYYLLGFTGSIIWSECLGFMTKNLGQVRNMGNMIRVCSGAPKMHGG